MSDQPCWHHTINCGSVYFSELKYVTVFIIIMKIIIMIIIMMVIKEKKNVTTNVTLLPRTLTLLNSWPQAPGPGQRGAGISCVSWIGALLRTVSGLPTSRDKHPSSSKKLMPLVILSVHCHSVNTSRKTADFFFSCLELLTVTLTLQHRH